MKSHSYVFNLYHDNATADSLNYRYFIRIHCDWKNRLTKFQILWNTMHIW